jgi:hypothetical protein
MTLSKISVWHDCSHAVADIVHAKADIVDAIDLGAASAMLKAAAMRKKSSYGMADGHAKPDSDGIAEISHGMADVPDTSHIPLLMYLL